MYAIYGLVDPRCLKIFYVGRTSKSLKKRLNEHLSDTDNTTLKRKRMLEIGAVTDEPILVVELEGLIPTEKEAFCREVFWIETMIKSGSPLTNAAIDFGGTYFLRDDTLEGTPDTCLTPVVPLYTSASNHWSADSTASDDDEVSIGLAAMEGKYFKVEEYVRQGHVLKSRNMTPERLNDMRLANMNAGRQLNHGLPVFDEEIGEILRRFERNSDIAALSIYFQRTEAVLKRYIEEALGLVGND